MRRFPSVLLLVLLFAAAMSARAADLRVDPTRTPRAIDLTRLDGTFAGQSSSGIYELNGTTLRICAPHRPGTARPTQFAAPRDSGLFLMTFKKIGN